MVVFVEVIHPVGQRVCESEELGYVHRNFISKPLLWIQTIERAGHRGYIDTE